MQLNITIPDKLSEEFNKAIKKTETTKKEIIIKAIEKFIKDNKQ
jgi:metal-responsive CopG/Arc/MetJ family transcriptional regulator